MKNTKISSLFPKRVNRNAKRTENTQEQNNTRYDIKQIAQYNKPQSNKEQDQYQVTAPERSPEQTTGGWGWVGEGLKHSYSQPTPTWVPMPFLIQKHTKNSARIKALNPANASEREHKNQTNHYIYKDEYSQLIKPPVIFFLAVSRRCFCCGLLFLSLYVFACMSWWNLYFGQRLATFWERNCPFGFLFVSVLIVVPLL